MKTIAIARELSSKAIFVVTAAIILSFAIGLSAFVHGDEILGRSGEHRSAISNLARELNKIADRDGGIGKELREVAKEQNNLKEEVSNAIDEVEGRGGLKIFFLGTDYKNLGIVRSAMVTTDNHIDRLIKAKERAANPAIAEDLDEQIVALQAEKTK